MYLVVRPDGARCWRLDFRRPDLGKRNTLSLGVYPDVSSSKAREEGDTTRKWVADGTNFRRC